MQVEKSKGICRLWAGKSDFVGSCSRIDKKCLVMILVATINFFAHERTHCLSTNV